MIRRRAIRGGGLLSDRAPRHAWPANGNSTQRRRGSEKDEQQRQEHFCYGHISNTVDTEYDQRQEASSAGVFAESRCRNYIRGKAVAVARRRSLDLCVKLPFAVAVLCVSEPLCRMPAVGLRRNLGCPVGDQSSSIYFRLMRNDTRLATSLGRDFFSSLRA